MAYEQYTYEFLLQRIMERVTTRNPNIDTREGSIMYDAIAPEALELAMAYLELEAWRNETHVSTATRVGLLELSKQIGIDVTLFDAKPCQVTGVFDVQVKVGSRWNCDLYNYVVTAYDGLNDAGQHEYTLQCETAGTEPNIIIGRLVPIDSTPIGLLKAEITKVTVEGTDEFTNDEIRTYYLNHVNGNAVDGNVEQYKTWCVEFPDGGIGNHRVEGLWNGDNTVLVAILSASNDIATPELIEKFQNYLDPPTATINDDVNAANYPQGRGMGNGKAPVGAIVTVKTGVEKVINVTANITLADGYTDYVGLENALKNYFTSISFVKKQVNYMSVGATLLDCPCVESISNLKINGGTSDIQLEGYEIPILGTTDWR